MSRWTNGSCSAGRVGIVIHLLLSDMMVSMRSRETVVVINIHWRHDGSYRGRSTQVGSEGRGNSLGGAADVCCSGSAW